MMPNYRQKQLSQNILVFTKGRFMVSWQQCLLHLSNHDGGFDKGLHNFEVVVFAKIKSNQS